MTSDHPRRSPRHRARTIAWTPVVEIERLMKDLPEQTKKIGGRCFSSHKIGLKYVELI